MASGMIAMLLAAITALTSPVTVAIEGVDLGDGLPCEVVGQSCVISLADLDAPIALCDGGGNCALLSPDNPRPPSTHDSWLTNPSQSSTQIERVPGFDHEEGIGCRIHGQNPLTSTCVDYGPDPGANVALDNPFALCDIHSQNPLHYTCVFVPQDYSNETHPPSDEFHE